MKKTAFIICSFLLAGRLTAETRHAGAAMELGVGARSLACGGYVAALYGQVDNFFANPAATGLILQPALSLMYAPTFGKINEPMAGYYYLGVAAPLFAGAAFGVHWTRFYVDDIPLYPKLSGKSLADRLENPSLRPDGSASGYFNDIEDVFYITFARTFKQLVPLSWLYGDLPVEIPVGINIKIIRQSLHQNHASALGLDLGAMLKFSMERLLDVDFLGDAVLAFSALDVAQTPMVWNTRHEDRVQRTLLFGLGYFENFGMSNGGVQFFYTHYEKYESAHLFGLEATWRGLALRSGAGPQGWNFGAGLRWRKLTVDYAFTTLDFSDSHRLGCSFSFADRRRP